MSSRSGSIAEAEGSLELFQQTWQIYRKMVDNNFLFHREAYATLHQALLEHFDRPFRFLDVACGDASASIGALKGTRIGGYHGIDLSKAALELAAESLPELGCPWTLEEADFPEALAKRREMSDVVWVGLSLHHFGTEGKRALMGAIRRIVAPGGLFLIFENASPDGEDRAGWLARFDRQESAWTAYTPAEWAAMRDHVHASDFPETDSAWRELARDAGFVSVALLYVTPSDLFRLYRMQ